LGLALGAHVCKPQLKSYRNLYAFLSQIISYQDSKLEKFSIFVWKLLMKLPSPEDEQTFVLDHEVVLQFFRLQQMLKRLIRLTEGEAASL